MDQYGQQQFAVPPWYPQPVITPMYGGYGYSQPMPPVYNPQPQPQYNNYQKPQQPQYDIQNFGGRVQQSRTDHRHHPYSRRPPQGPGATFYPTSEPFVKPDQNVRPVQNVRPSFPQAQNYRNNGSNRNSVRPPVNKGQNYRNQDNGRNSPRQRPNFSKRRNDGQTSSHQPLSVPVQLDDIFDFSLSFLDNPKWTRPGGYQNISGPGRKFNWKTRPQCFLPSLKVFGSKEAKTFSESRRYLARKNQGAAVRPDEPIISVRRFGRFFDLLTTPTELEKFLWSNIETLRQIPKDHPRLEVIATQLIAPTALYVNGVAKGDKLRRLVNKTIVNPLYPSPFSNQSVRNTLAYLFNHIGQGVYVLIRQNQMVMFVPFFNRDYRNNFTEQIIFGPNFCNYTEYYRHKHSVVRASMPLIGDVKRWNADGPFLQNEKRYPFAAEEHLCQLFDLLQATTSYRVVPDCEFFINNQDFPVLKSDLTEPNSFFFGSNTPLPDIYRDYVNSSPPESSVESVSEESKSMDDSASSQISSEETTLEKTGFSFVMSSYVSSGYADVPFPSTEDWQMATGDIIPPLCDDRYSKSLRKFLKKTEKWNDKLPTAFFRGTSEGVITKNGLDQRTSLVLLAKKWATDPRYNGAKEQDLMKFLDAKLTGHNTQDIKKQPDVPISFPNNSNQPPGLDLNRKWTLVDNGKYKYNIYVPGYKADPVYGFLMLMGTVILKVQDIEPAPASQLWYFPLLEPFVDHVPVKADLSDLAEKIEWCKRNDSKCEIIGKRAAEFYRKYLSKVGIMDYTQMLLSKFVEADRKGDEHKKQLTVPIDFSNNMQLRDEYDSLSSGPSLKAYGSSPFNRTSPSSTPTSNSSGGIAFAWDAIRKANLESTLSVKRPIALIGQVFACIVCNIEYPYSSQCTGDQVKSALQPVIEKFQGIDDESEKISPVFWKMDPGRQLMDHYIGIKEQVKSLSVPTCDNCRLMSEAFDDIRQNVASWIESLTDIRSNVENVPFCYRV